MKPKCEVEGGVFLLGCRLRAARQAAGLTIDQLARSAEVNWMTISNCEHGKNLPTLENAVKLCETLKVSLDWMCGLEPNPEGTEEAALALLMEDGLPPRENPINSDVVGAVEILLNAFKRLAE